MLTEAYVSDAMKSLSVSEWHKRFKEGREDVKDDERTGCPKTHRADENVEKMRKLVRSDRRLNVRMMDGRGTKFRQRNCEEDFD
jgi:hypothetical protein